MRALILAVGRMKSGAEAELAERYLKRMSGSARALGLQAPRIVEIAESRAGNADTRKREEAAQLLAKLPVSAFTVALDETGDQLTSAEFSRTVARCRDEGVGDMALMIGGADGFDREILKRSNRVLSFGRMTLPHQLVRVLVLEQLYRATTILAGHPYHRE